MGNLPERFRRSTDDGDRQTAELDDQAGGLAETELKSGIKAMFVLGTHWIPR